MSSNQIIIKINVIRFGIIMEWIPFFVIFFFIGFDKDDFFYVLDFVIFVFGNVLLYIFF
jgi:hypothetical protein